MVPARFVQLLQALDIAKLRDALGFFCRGRVSRTCRFAGSVSTRL